MTTPAHEPYDEQRTLLSEPVLEVHRRATLVRTSAPSVIRDQLGRHIGSVRRVDQGRLRAAVRVLTPYDQLLTRALHVCDLDGTPVLVLTRPARLARTRLVVADAAGVELGQVVLRIARGRTCFDLVAGEEVVGSIRAEDRRHRAFSVRDEDDVEVARITRVRDGLVRRLVTVDHHVLRIDPSTEERLEGPLRALVVAAAAGIGTALTSSRQTGGIL